MKLRQIFRARLLLLLALLGVGIGGFGCASQDETQNTSPKPWNSPEGYNNGAIPSMMQSH